jgi:hypothetical protein
METKNNHWILIIVGVLILLVVGYYLSQLILPVQLPESGKSAITDAKTGDPIPQKDVARIMEKQEKERLIYVLTGKVSSKSSSALEIEIPANNQPGTRILQATFSPKMVFLKEVPLAGVEKESSATEEKQISLAEVNIGDTITIVFPRGTNFSELNTRSAIEISNLIVNMPQGAGMEND